MSLPSIMVAMTHRNHDEYTNLAIRSAQSGLPMECIVVFDDGSLVPYSAASRLVRLEESIGWNAVASKIVTRWIQSEAEYLVITNNDVVFVQEDWWSRLVRCFEDHEDCGIAGPVTNQAGHQPKQGLSEEFNDIAYMHKFAAEWDERFGAKAPYREKVVPFVNGFCFMLKRDRVLAIGDGPVFQGGGDLNYGGEDHYQRNMAKAGLKAYCVIDSFVFHFKDVTLGSARHGRLGLVPWKLPRLRERGSGSYARAPVHTLNGQESHQPPEDLGDLDEQSESKTASCQEGNDSATSLSSVDLGPDETGS